MATANSTGRARPAREITGLPVLPGEPSAQFEEETSAPVNLASLPKKEALKRARIAGRQILGDGDALESVTDTIWIEWLNANAPCGVGQSDDELGELVDAMCDEFFAGLSEGVEQFQSTSQPQENDRTLSRVKALLNEKSGLAWKVHNTLTFMIEALPSDKPEGLPVQCTLVELKKDMDKLATDLMDLVHHARETGDE